MMYLVRYYDATSPVGEGARRDSAGSLVPNRHYVLWPEPQHANQSDQPLAEGWLGTSNDIDAEAYGGYDSPDAARAAAEAICPDGLQVVAADPDYDRIARGYLDDGAVAVWAARPPEGDWWDARDYIGPDDLADQIRSLGLDEAIAAVTAEAADNGIRLVGLREAAELVADN